MSTLRPVLLCTAAFTVATLLGGCGATSVPVSNNTNSGTGPVPTVIAQAVEVNGVAPNRKQEVQFSEAMNPATINDKTFVVTDAGGNTVPGDVSYDSSFNIGIFAPDPALKTGTTYTATITTGAASTGGMHLAAPYAYSFATRADTDSSPLTVTQVSPAANAVCVSATAQITITFDEAPDASTVTAQNIVVTDSNGDKIATTLSTNINTTQVVVTPASPLPSGTITVTVSGVADLADVAMQQPYTWSFSTACNGGGGGGGAGTQIVYVIDGSTLTTYDINSQTLQATQAGTVTLPQAVYPNIMTSPDGHFVYYSAYADFNQTGLKLWVYATNSSGVPQTPPVQELDNVSAPEVNPAGTLAYTVSVGPTTTTNGIQTTAYQIVSYQRDAATGLLSNPTIQATYDLESEVSALYCTLSLDGFSPLGDELYNHAYCASPHGSSSATYNERSVNLATGALGPNQQVYSWENGSSGGERIQFVRNLLFDFAMPSPTISLPNYVKIYPIQPNTSTPVAQCTSTMQAVCGSFVLGNAHPSGQYAFLTDPQNVTQILRVDTTAMQLTPTGSSIPYEVQQFSPDGQVAYGVNDVNSAFTIEIYGFNASSAAVTQGGTIQVPSTLDSWFVSERY